MRKNLKNKEKIYLFSTDYPRMFFWDQIEAFSFEDAIHAFLMERGEMYNSFNGQISYSLIKQLPQGRLLFRGVIGLSQSDKPFIDCYFVAKTHLKYKGKLNNAG